MGGSNSSERSITVEEKWPENIMVSDSVSKRLLGLPEGSKDERRDVTMNEDELMRSKNFYEDELTKSKNFYEKKVEELENKNAAHYDLCKAQFHKAVEEVEQKFMDVTSSPICEDLQSSVLRCYQQNPKEPLHCSAAVRAFSECVQRQREKMLTSQNRMGSS